MRVKNVSSTEIKIKQFELYLTPGEIGDLSQFDPKDIHSNKTLKAYFNKGLLINLGNSTPVGSIAALKSAKDRIEKLGLKDYIPKKSSNSLQSPNNRKKIAEVLKQSNIRNTPKSGFNPQNERFHDEYHRNMDPANPDKQVNEPIPRPKIDDKFRSMQLDPSGVVTEFGANGKIETAVLTGNNTALNIMPTPTKQETSSDLKVSDKDGNQYQVSLEAIKERLKKKCLGFSNSGKPCKKYAVTGFNSCLTHMSKSEKKKYERIKQSQKS